MIWYIAPFYSPTGYGQAARDYALALVRAGAKLRITSTTPGDLDSRYAELEENNSNGAVTHIIVHVPPATAALAVEKVIGEFCPSVPRTLITTWETSHMPGQMAAEIDRLFDQVIVPSRFCADALFGVLEKKVRIVPHCFDPDEWLDDGRPGGDLYTFYSILSWSERKNPMGLLKAYLAEFSGSDDVMLKIKTPNYHELDIELLVASLGYEDLAPVEIVTEFFDHDGLLDFHTDNSCFVTTARGEGWNLPAFEAAILGKPVIAPRWGGHLDFLDDYQNAHLIGGSLTPAISTPAIQNGAAVISAPNGVTARQRWFEPDLFSTQRMMRRAYEEKWQPDNSSRKILEDRFGYNTVGKQLKAVIGE